MSLLSVSCPIWGIKARRLFCWQPPRCSSYRAMGLRTQATGHSSPRGNLELARVFTQERLTIRAALVVVVAHAPEGDGTRDAQVAGQVGHTADCQPLRTWHRVAHHHHPAFHPVALRPMAISAVLGQVAL